MVALNARTGTGAPSLPAAVVLLAALLASAGCGKKKTDEEPPLGQGYVGSANCAPCHGPYPNAGGPAYHADWLTTAHGKTGNTTPADAVIVADANANGTNDFKDGRNLAGDSAWSAYGALAPRLGYDALRAAYTVALGPRTFDVEKVAGIGRHQQLYLTRIENSLYVLPALYDAGAKAWRTFQPENWYTWTDTNGDGFISAGEAVTGVRYAAPSDTAVSLARTGDSWEANCAGCHATGITSLAANGRGEFVAQLTEDGAGCESCHGPGRIHVATLGGNGHADRAIVNPAKLTSARYNDVCMGCHTRGQSTGAVAGRKMEFPWRTDGTAFLPGQALADAFVPGDKAVEPLHRLQGTHVHSGLAGSRYGAWTTGCSVCHTPHFATNLSLVRSTIDTTNSGARAVVFTHRSGAPGSGGLMGDATDGTYTDVCEVCHTKTQYFRNNASTPVTTHNNGAACTDCHLHWRGFPTLESPGGRDCSQCHSDLVTAMEDATATGYHHLMANAAATYPTSSATPKNCLSCHADHDVFSPDLNPANGGRGKNLRVSIAAAPTTSANFTNTDFVNAGSGGLCLSCHAASLAKGYPQPDATTATPAIPYAGATPSVYNAIPHGGTFAVASTFTGAGTNVFQANCSKCHNDTMSPKSAVLAQAGPVAFGNHDSVLGRILAPLGLAAPADPLGNAFCFRCHSRTADAVGGTPKPAAGRDWYNAADMSATSELLFQVFATKASRHVAAGTPGPHRPIEGLAAGWNAGATRHVECADCHNPHASADARAFDTSGVFAQPLAPASAVSGPLQGVWGVTVAAWPAAWASPALSRIEACTEEWQVCLKCHSSYAYNATPPAGQTNLAVEFNPNNPGYHAVAGASKTTQGTYVAPWTSASRMACSDCHTTDVKTEPQGPHGSANDAILAGPFNATTGQAGTSGHLCYKCHDFAVYSTGAGGTGTGFRSSTANLHGRHLMKAKPGAGRNVACWDCHAAVPHGMNRRSLIVLQGDPAPYNGGDAAIASIIAATPGTWDKPSCTTACHNESNGGQDCDGCHHDLVVATTSVSPLTYHHLLGNSGATYPTSAATAKNCLSCHADHDLFRPDLNAANGGRGKNLRTDIAAAPTTSTNFTNTDFVNAGTGGICLSCHAASRSKGYTQPDATTATPAIPYAGAAPAVFNGSLHGGAYTVASTFSGAGTNVFQANCTKCHNDTMSPKSDKAAQSGPYTFGDHESVLRQILAPLGIASPADPIEETFCYRCHSTTGDAVGGTKKTVANRDWYNAAAMSARAEGIYARVTANTGSTYSHPVGATSGLHHPVEGAPNWNPAATRHVECADCHNPHATTTPRTFNTAGTFAQPAAGTNLVSGIGPLAGVWGVSVTWPAAWTVPVYNTAYAKVDSSTNEWQVCLKCHSSYAYNATPPAGQTDQALEFNPNNAAYHAVAGASKTTQGTYASPWTSSSAMACSDCHTSNVKTGPQGPHGSGVNHILAGTFDSTTGSSTSGGHLCFKCHDFATYVSGSGLGTGFRGSGNNLHGKHMTGEGKRCVNCHTAVPHGFNRHALIVFTGDASPYNKGDARINSLPGGFPAPGNWQKDNCSTGSGCH